MPDNEASSFSEYERNLIANVEKYGWQFTFVFDPDGNDPDFGYSIGFPETLGCGDFVVMGLDKDVMHHMLWEVFEQIKAGKKPHDNATWEQLVGGDYVCVSRKVTEENRQSAYFNSSRWYIENAMQSDTPFEFFQLIWPSTGDSLYPWDEACPEEVIAAQPRLY